MDKLFNPGVLADALDEHAIVSATDTAGNIVYVNQKFIDISGYPESELLGNNHRMLKSGIHPPAFYEQMWSTLLHGKTWQGEVCNRRKNGALYWVRASVKPILDDNGLPVHYLSIRTDITEIKQAEENSLLSQTLLRSVIDAIPDLIFFKDADGKYLGCNTAFERYLGTPEALIIGCTNVDFVDQKTAELFCEQDALMLSARKPRTDEQCISYPDGRQAHMEITRMPYYYGGVAPGVIGIGHDITGRLQQMKSLRESEERWAFAIEGAGDGVWDWEMGSGKMLLSRLYETMLGYGEHELPQTIDAWVTSVHPDDLARVQKKLQDYLSGKDSTYVVELRLTRKGGGYKWVLCRGTVVERDANGNPVRMIGIHSDIDERKQTENSLNLFKRIFEASEQAIGVADGEGRLLYINPAHERMHRWRQEDVAGRHFSIFLPDEALELAPAIIEATDRGESWVGLLPQKRSDGSLFTSSSHINALQGANGKPQYVFNILYDYTTEIDRQQELRSARDKADAANKAKSEFLSGMSHELRTPMNAILGFAQLMEGDNSITADQRENLQHISKAGWHLLDLINEVLDLASVESGQSKLELENIDPAAIVMECLSLVSPLVSKKRIAVENNIGRDTPSVCADYLRLKQILINLLSNAIKYNSDGGSLVIDVKCGEDIAICVKDTGIGMTHDQMAKLFEPFTRFGNTERVQGTGIGLSICKKLAERMNGQMLVESIVGQGSVFSVVLPRGDATVCEAIEHDAPISLLYIEDDAAQQSLLSKWAVNQGWGIEFAHDAASGIDAAMKCRYDVILLDIDLPGGFSGLDVKAVLDDMESLRTTPVIGISNLVQKPDMERARQAGFATYLAKPVDLQELERIIRRTIRAGGGE
jgi:PAS domain S-box-containing protein